MNNETNRLAQIIGRAADKYRGLAGLRPTEQDKAAALAIEAEYLFIRRDELPATTILHKQTGPELEVEGAEIGTWPLKHPKNTAEQQRKYALEYLAAHIAIQQWHDDALERRRDELARQFANDKTSYNNGISPALQAAIDRIIELEASRADVV